MSEPMPTAADFEALLFRHVIDVWFPRCLDTRYGGFLCDFDRTWKESGPHEKLVEFQARQTLTAADLSAAFPKDERLRLATEHGFRCLSEMMWDTDAGGWFHKMDRAGKIMERGTKHAHGAAYAIEACAAVYTANRNPAALELAKEGFRWLEDHSRDREHRGYFGFLRRDNSVIRDPAQWTGSADTVGTEIGFKDANVHSDLIETFAELHKVWPDPLVHERLAEVVELVTGKMVVRATGAMHIFVTADWTPVPHLTRSGYQFQTAFRLGLARDILGDAQRLNELACRLVDHTMRYHRDSRNGGFFYASPGSAPTWLGGVSTLVRDKPWWPQVEAQKALLAVSRIRPEQTGYLEHFRSMWGYLQRSCLDHAHGGMYARVLDCAPRWRRALGVWGATAAATLKGDAWKDASHDGRAWLYCRSALQQ
jgi:mannobiose 2-epimerase